MDKSTYQSLRFSVENEVANFNSGIVDTDALINSVMRLFLQAVSNEQVKRQTFKREFLTFRRRSDVIVPGWAFHPTGKGN
ncbi:hypothetical protein ACCD10_27785 [Pseudomonas sp. Pseusp122]|uniref:hypothetical protein n=1 Tax=unclassified Pseudomonas TaxID=196821 RepID=UPI0039A5650A